MKILQLEARQVEFRTLSTPKTFTFGEGKIIQIQIRRVLRGSFDIRGRFESVGTYENECVVSGTLIFAEGGLDEKVPRTFEIILTREDADDFSSTVAALMDHLGRNLKPQKFVANEYVATLHNNIVVAIVQETPERSHDRWEFNFGPRKATLIDSSGKILPQVKEAVAMCAHWQADETRGSAVFRAL